MVYVLALAVGFLAGWFAHAQRVAALERAVFRRIGLDMSLPPVCGRFDHRGWICRKAPHHAGPCTLERPRNDTLD